MKNLIFLLLFFTYVFLAFSQTPDLVVYRARNPINSIADGGDCIWATDGTDMIRFDKSTRKTEIFAAAEHGFSFEKISDIEVGGDGKVWICGRGIGFGSWYLTYFLHEGCAYFDGKNWNSLTPENSDLPSDVIVDLETDQHGDVYFMYFLEEPDEDYPMKSKLGLCKYSDDSFRKIDLPEIDFLDYWDYWTLFRFKLHGDRGAWISGTNRDTYDGSVSGMLYCDFASVESRFYDYDNYRHVKNHYFEIDSEGNLWIFNWDDYAYKFDGNSWEQVYLNGGMLTLAPGLSTIDKDDNIWSAALPQGGETRSSLTKFDGENVELFNSGIAPVGDDDNIPNCILAVEDGSIWLAVDNKLVEFKNGNYNSYNAGSLLPSYGVSKIRFSEEKAWLQSGRFLIDFDENLRERADKIPASRSFYTYCYEKADAFEIDSEGNIWLDYNEKLVDGKLSKIDLTYPKDFELYNPVQYRALPRKFLLDENDDCYFLNETILYRRTAEQDASLDSVGQIPDPPDYDKLYPLSYFRDPQGRIWISVMFYFDGNETAGAAGFASYVYDSGELSKLEYVCKPLADSLETSEGIPVSILNNGRILSMRVVDGENWMLASGSNKDHASDSRLILYKTDCDKITAIPVGIGAEFGLPDTNALAVDSERNAWIGSSGGLYIASENEDIHKFEGLPGDNVQDVQIDKEGNVWIATTQGLAIYRKGGVVLSAEDETLEPTDLRLSAYPNPFTKRLIMNYELREAGHVSLKVYDLMGNEVAKLVDGFMPASRHEAQFDAAGLPSGVYLIELRACGQILTEKVIIHK